ncbi:MAG: snoRNA-binding rRNA-processing protein imp4, partial [Marteilia pararefringens]
GLIVSHLPYGPTAFFTLHNVLLRHSLKDKDLPGVSQAAPHLVFHNFTTDLGDRVSKILKFLFAVPNYDSKRTVSFYNSNDIISLRHHTYKQDSNNKKVTLTELGPRMDLQRNSMLEILLIKKIIL